MKNIIAILMVFFTTMQIYAISPHHRRQHHVNVSHRAQVLPKKTVFRPARPIPPAPPVHAHKHHFWGKGGSYFWPGFVGGITGSIIRPIVVDSSSQTTPIVVGPIATTDKIWIPPVYESRPIIDVFGRIIGYERVIVRPGYWQ